MHSHVASMQYFLLKKGFKKVSLGFHFRIFSNADLKGHRKKARCYPQLREFDHIHGPVKRTEKFTIFIWSTSAKGKLKKRLHRFPIDISELFPLRNARGGEAVEKEWDSIGKNTRARQRFRRWWWSIHSSMYKVLLKWVLTLMGQFAWRYSGRRSIALHTEWGDAARTSRDLRKANLLFKKTYNDLKRPYLHES